METSRQSFIHLLLLRWQLDKSKQDVTVFSEGPLLSGVLWLHLGVRCDSGL